MRTEHYWTETHPKLAVEPDMLAVLEKHEKLTPLLLDPSEAELVRASGALRKALAELKDAKASLRESKDQSLRLAAIVKSSDDGIYSIDAGGLITSWDKAAKRLFGYLSDEVIGEPLTILIPPERLHEEQVILGGIHSGDRIDHYETVRRRKNGSLVDVSLTIFL
jgi:PAS domain S-box-containing protein